MKAILIQEKPQHSLLLLSAFCLGLLGFRMIVTGSIFYGFLVWNLVLAAVPLAITAWLSARPSLHVRTVYLCGVSLLWLLFFPNAPYILTDFLHFKGEHAMPGWFDVLLLASFSLTGLLLGLGSLSEMQRIWEERFSWTIVRWMNFGCCVLAGFGIYLGRFLRYNSWDIIGDPLALLADIPAMVCELNAIGLSLGYGTLIFLSSQFLDARIKVKP
jgi:uncharacterized membrane protein